MSEKKDTDVAVTPRSDGDGHEVTWEGGGWKHRRWFADRERAQQWARLLPWRLWR